MLLGFILFDKKYNSAVLLTDSAMYYIVFLFLNLWAVMNLEKTMFYVRVYVLQ